MHIHYDSYRSHSDLVSLDILSHTGNGGSEAVSPTDSSFIDSLVFAEEQPLSNAEKTMINEMRAIIAQLREENAQLMNANEVLSQELLQLRETKDVNVVFSSQTN